MSQTPGLAEIILDPGHTPGKPGAVSVRGISEVKYNDNLCRIVADSLKAHNVNTFITRKADEEITLDDRVNRSNATDALAMISLHHDSAQPQYLKKVNGNYTTIRSIAGYSIFVSKLNCNFKESYLLAVCIANELLKLSRKPTLHHAENISGENRALLDSTLGIYDFDDLIVLKKTKHPSVLIEFGVLVDKDDEQYVSNLKNQQSFAEAITNGVIEFRKALEKSSATRNAETTLKNGPGVPESK